MLDFFPTNRRRVAVEHNFKRRARDVTETLTDDGLVILLSSTVLSHKIEEVCNHARFNIEHGF